MYKKCCWQVFPVENTIQMLQQHFTVNNLHSSNPRPGMHSCIKPHGSWANRSIIQGLPLPYELAFA